MSDAERARYKRYRERHRKKLSERQKAWRRAHPIERRATTMLASAKLRAGRKGLNFNLTLAWLLPRLRPMRCQATGEGLRLGSAKNLCPTIDRRNNSKGYTRTNCWVVSYKFNRLKGSKDLRAVLPQKWPSHRMS